MSDGIDALIAEAELGEEARNFVKSQLGILMIESCKQDRAIALEKLAATDPFDDKAIRAASNAVKVAEMFEAKLVEIIMNGNNALEIWQQQNPR